MANFVRVYPSGLPFDHPPGSANLTLLDLQVSKAVNGDGGVWAPLTPITIGGSGLEVTGAFVTANLTTNGAVTIQSGGSIVVQSGAALTVQGTLTISNGVEFATPRSYTRSSTGTIWFDATEWGAGTNGMFFLQNTPPGSGGSQTPVSWVLDVPAGSTITSITWYIDPAGGHGALPGTLPSLLVRELNPADGTSTNIVTMADTSPDVGTYEAAHTIASGVLAYATTAGRIVVASMLGEKGANEVAGGRFYPPVVTFTRTTVSEA